MNNLSWLIYLSGISEGFNSGFKAICFFGILGVIVVAGIKMIRHYENMQKYDSFVNFKVLLALLGIGLFSNVFPSKETLLLIGASEFAETVATNEKVLGTVDPAIQYLQEWLNKGITDLKTSKEIEKVNK